MLQEMINATKDINQVLKLNPPIPTEDINEEDLKAYLNMISDLVEPYYKLKKETRKLFNILGIELRTEIREPEKQKRKRRPLKIDRKKTIDLMITIIVDKYKDGVEKEDIVEEFYKRNMAISENTLNSMFPPFKKMIRYMSKRGMLK